MTNARTIIEQAARKIHVLGRGVTMPADEMTSALKALNNVLGQMSVELGAIYNSTKETFNLTASDGVYTIGNGGDFNTTKPLAIESAFISISTYDYPLRVLNVSEYGAIRFKALGSIPDSIYFEDNTPLGKIYLHPVPSAAYTLTLYSRKPLTSFADINADYDLPTGLENALVWALAVALCPEYEKEPTPFVLSQANKSMTGFETSIRRNNYPVSDLDFGGRATGNIYNGWMG